MVMNAKNIMVTSDSPAGYCLKNKILVYYSPAGFLEKPFDIDEFALSIEIPACKSKLWRETRYA